MHAQPILKIAAVLALAFGFCFVLAPQQLAVFYNLSMNPAGIYVGRLFGALLIGVGILNWMSSTVHDDHEMKAVLVGNLVGDAIGLMIALYVQMNGIANINRLGWSTVGIYLLLTIGFAYLLVEQHLHHDLPSVRHG
jgi:hypothetical protein